jgi:class 3 adenylate cyclase
VTPASLREVGSRQTLALGVLLLLPLAGVVLLLARPELDPMWEHHPSHFWLVLGVALVNVALGWATGEAARRHDDMRLFLVSLALLSSAAFLGLHALATPGVLLHEPNTGFVIATPIGLLLSAAFAAASAPSERTVAILRRRRRALRIGLELLVVGWGAVSLSNASPALSGPPPDEAPAALRILAPIGVALYAFAALRYADVYRRRRETLPLAVTVAFVLLAEAMIVVIVGRSWHASWWEWHLLMAIAFGTIAAAARAAYARERSVPSAFGGLYLDRTLERLDRGYSDALAEVVGALEASAPLGPVMERLRSRGFGGEERSVLERSARELRRVDALFRPYVGPHLARRLVEEPELASLGGSEVDVSVLFADLAGFTPFAETRAASEVVEMLNAYWAAVVPAIAQGEGGVIERFAGDAVLAVFNALDDQRDHALRAARAALAICDGAEHVRAAHPDWPRFRIGVNSGPAVIGNVGSGEQRSFTAIGDTTNVAARLHAVADPGQVLITAETYRRVERDVLATPVGPLRLKGKSQPVEAFALAGVRGTESPSKI